MAPLTVYDMKKLACYKGQARTCSNKILTVELQNFPDRWDQLSFECFFYVLRCLLFFSIQFRLFYNRSLWFWMSLATNHWLHCRERAVKVLKPELSLARMNQEKELRAFLPFWSLKSRVVIDLLNQDSRIQLPPKLINSKLQRTGLKETREAKWTQTPGKSSLGLLVNPFKDTNINRRAKATGMGTHIVNIYLYYSVGTVLLCSNLV